MWRDEEIRAVFGFGVGVSRAGPQVAEVSRGAEHGPLQAGVGGFKVVSEVSPNGVTLDSASFNPVREVTSVEANEPWSESNMGDLFSGDHGIECPSFDPEKCCCLHIVE